MHKLELKIPPVALVFLFAFAMWGISQITPSIEIPKLINIAGALFFFIVGTGVSISGVIAFKRARTTVNPTKPDSTSSLVSSGIYSFTRNPMYLGFLLVLIGWAVFLSNALAFLGPFFFVLYMNRFQITPEEKALTSIFGAEFSEYKDKVRRWI